MQPDRQRSDRHFSFLLCFSLLLAFGCKEELIEKDPGVDASGPAQADLGWEEWSDDESDPEHVFTPPTSRTLSPTIRTVGSAGSIPRHISASFAWGLFSPDDFDGPRPVGAQTSWTITPAMEIEAQLISASEMKFLPRTPFTPSTEYTFTLNAVESADDAILSDGEPWQLTFTTPPFQLLTPGSALHADGKVSLLLRFSLPANYEDVRKNTRWQAQGKTLRADYTPTDDPSEIRVTMEGVAADARTLHMSMGAVGAAEFDASTDPMEHEFLLVSGAPLTIRGVHAQEGPQGWYVSVNCLEPQTGRSRGSRCGLDQDEVRNIRFEPAVENLRISPASRGFHLTGNFSRGAYTLRFDPGLQTQRGAVLHASVEHEISFGARQPLLYFAQKGRYVPKDDWSRVSVTHRNTPEVDVIIRHVPTQNVAFWQSGRGDAFSQRDSRLVARQTVELAGHEDRENVSTIDLTELVPSPEPGAYEILIRSGQASDRIAAFITDLNLVVKRSSPPAGSDYANEAFVWVLGMRDNRPIHNAEVSWIRPNGDAVARCRTDGSGGCVLVIQHEDIDDTPPMGVLVTRDDDVTFAHHRDLRVSAEDVDVHGEAWHIDSSFRAAIWSGRDLYRPGETMELAAIIRGDHLIAPRQGVPVTIRVMDPRGQIAHRHQGRTDETGLVAFRHRFGDWATTGPWRAEVHVAGRRLETFAFHVEEFVPERMEVRATPVTPHVLRDAPIEVDVFARFLFGGSARNSPVEVHCELTPAEFRALPGQGYIFAQTAAQNTPDAMDLGKAVATLDEKGEARVACPQTAGDIGTRPYRARISVAVSEAGSGRVTRQHTNVMVHPANHYIGLRAVEPSEDFQIEGVIVDMEGQITEEVSSVELSWIRIFHDWSWWWDPDFGVDDFGRYQRPHLEKKLSVAVKEGRFSARTPAGRWERWIAQVTTDGARTDLSRGRTFSHRSTETPRPGQPIRVPIEVPESAKPGEPVQVRVDIPFDGRVLLTAETHRVIRYEWRDVQEGSLDWHFTLGDYVPNVYVSALVLKDPHAQSRTFFAPDRAFGVQSVRIQPTHRQGSLSIEAPEEVRPNQSVDVVFDVGDAGTATNVLFAAVDEGILQMTNYRAPDPSVVMTPRRALEVATFETIGWAFGLNHGGTTSRTGGGADLDWEDTDADALGRVVAIRPVALVSGVLTSDADGKVRTTLDIPAFQGSLRVMAVALTPKSTAVAQRRMTVRDPLALQTTTPRFLTAEDRVQIPVFLTNGTGSDQTVDVQIATSAHTEAQFETNPLRVIGAQSQRVTIANGTSETVYFEVTATEASGAGVIRVEASAGDHSSFSEDIVPIRPAGALITLTQTVELQPGVNDLREAVSGWVPTSDVSRVWVTPLREGSSFAHLSYLIRYPYGCMEQTSSTLRPLVFLADLLEMQGFSRADAAEKISAGISRILSMQTRDGGFSYWPGSQDSHIWASALGIHILLDAKDQGFAVPMDRVERAISWLRSQAQRVDGHNAPYVHYVLARAGQGMRGEILRQIDALPPARNGWQLEREFLLKAALYQSGDRRYEAFLLAPDTRPVIEGERESRWTFYSERRRRAMTFAILVDTFDNRSELEPLKELVQGMMEEESRSSWYTTQELMWSLTGLGKWVAAEAAQAEVGDLYVSERPRRPDARNRFGATWNIPRAGERDRFEIRAPAEGLRAVIVSQGVRADEAASTVSRGIRVEKSLLNAEGTRISSAALGDVVWVKLELTNSGSALHNVAVVDRFAAGFEIENPRLDGQSVPVSLQSANLWTIDHMNARDDRLEVFGSLPSGKTTLIYGLRAVASGSFTDAGTTAEGMYEPSRFGRLAPGLITIKAGR